MLSPLIVWNKWKTKMIRSYHGVYLKCDVLLLVNIVESFKIR